MTWELLTKVKIFGEEPDMSAAVDILTGVKPLPTEQPLSEEVRRGLGNSAYRDSVIAMLSREPTQRPTIDDVVQRWTSVFQSTMS